MSYEKEEEKCYLIQLTYPNRHKIHWGDPKNQNILYYTYGSYQVIHCLNIWSPLNPEYTLFMGLTGSYIVSISEFFSIWGFH